MRVECGSELDTSGRGERMERVKNDSWAFGLGTRRMELLLAETEKSGVEYSFILEGRQGAKWISVQFWKC